MASGKRQRAPNFTPGEVMHLCTIIEDYKSTIECKKTDGTSMQRKQIAWECILNQYNASTPSCTRTVENLMACYKNQKAKAKKHYSEEKMKLPVPPAEFLSIVEDVGTNWEEVSTELHVTPDQCKAAFEKLVGDVKKKDRIYKKAVSCTGGGPPPADDADEIYKKVKGLMGSQIEGLYTVYGGDAAMMQEHQLQLPAQERSCPIEIEDEYLDDEDVLTAAAGYHALPTPRPGSLEPVSDKPGCSSHTVTTPYRNGKLSRAPIKRKINETPASEVCQPESGSSGPAYENPECSYSSATPYSSINRNRAMFKKTRDPVVEAEVSVPWPGSSELVQEANPECYANTTPYRSIEWSRSTLKKKKDPVLEAQEHSKSSNRRRPVLKKNLTEHFINLSEGKHELVELQKEYLKKKIEIEHLSLAHQMAKQDIEMKILQERLEYERKERQEEKRHKQKIKEQEVYMNELKIEQIKRQ